MQELSAGWVWGSPQQGRGGTRSLAPALGNWKGPRASEGVLQNQPPKTPVLVQEERCWLCPRAGSVRVGHLQRGCAQGERGL